MKRYLFNYLLLLALLLTACSNDEEEQEYNYSPRAKMMYEFVKHHLQPGLSRQRIVNLLGKPFYEGVIPNLPKGMTVPDSILNTSIYSSTDERTDAINEFFRTHSQPDTVLKYRVEDGLMDPTMLIIKFDDKGIARDFSIETD
ncbi:hypothetical protein [Telluribacter humicola]|uniref:hypothetical protein n=1 Tax=Telluribacter humicola TaxID=1720261 RepID=UPI001A969C5E|nr:hypothetical protein [Telluribacter humicola]